MQLAMEEEFNDRFKKHGIEDTGKKDKNGVSIYTGDTVRIVSESIVGTVMWKETFEAFVMCYTDESGSVGSILPLYTLPLKNVEVVEGYNGEDIHKR